MYRISIVGAGNVAFRLSLALVDKGFGIEYVCNRSEKNLERLLKALRSNGSSAAGATDLSCTLGSNIVIIAVSDSAIGSVIEEFAGISDKCGTASLPVFLHTSGATPIDVFAPLARLGAEYGVLYPLMTLSRNKNIDFKHVPMLLEASSDNVRARLDAIATALGSEHYFYDSEYRLKMHVAAVFASNFVNYLLGLAFPIVQRDHPLLLPLTLETVRNCYLHTPASTLTGPARRGDMETIGKHLELLGKCGLTEQEEIYRLITGKILEKIRK